MILSFFLRMILSENRFPLFGIMRLIHKPHAAGVAQVVAAHFLRARGKLIRMQELEQRLQGGAEVVALAHHQVERLPNDRYEIEPGGIGDRARRDPGVGAAGADRLRDIGAGRADRADGGELVERGFRPMQQGQQQQLRAGALRTHGDARALGDHVVDRTDLERIAGRQQEALLAAAECDHHRVLHIAAARHRRDIGVGVRIFQRMQMHGGGDGLAAVKRAKPASLPTASVARPEPLSRKAHSSSGSWLPPTIGAGSGRVSPAGRETLEASQ